MTLQPRGFLLQGPFPGLVFVTLCSFPPTRPPSRLSFRSHKIWIGLCSCPSTVSLLGLRARARGMENFQYRHCFKTPSHSLSPLCFKPSSHYSEKSKDLITTTRPYTVFSCPCFLLLHLATAAYASLFPECPRHPSWPLLSPRPGPLLSSSAMFTAPSTSGSKVLFPGGLP